MIAKDEILKEIDVFKKHRIETVSKIMTDLGGLEPMISVLVHRNDSGKTGIVNFMIPGEIMSSESGKDILAELMPQLIKAVAANNFEPLCVSWSSEAWLRRVDKSEVDKDPELIKNWESLPKKESVIIYFESEFGTEMNCRLIERNKVVNEAGELIDVVKIVEDEELLSQNPAGIEGRFTNLFRKVEKKGE